MSRRKIMELLYPREKGEGFGRRRFLSVAGWASLAASLGTMLGGLVRFAFPNVLYEPPSRVNIGKPEDYLETSVTFLADKRLFVFREKAGIRAMSAVCTHLGCTTRPFVKADEEYDMEHSHCPCHGSVFTKEGTVLRGPAPRPLESHRVALLANGQLQVDQGKIVAANEYLKA